MNTRTSTEKKNQLTRLLPLLTIACLATCAIAGLALGVYDIAYTSINFEIPQASELVLGR